MCGLMSDLVICKFWKSMVMHDTECPHWDQVSLSNTNPNPSYQIHPKSQGVSDTFSINWYHEMYTIKGSVAQCTQYVHCVQILLLTLQYVRSSKWGLAVTLPKCVRQTSVCVNSSHLTWKHQGFHRKSFRFMLPDSGLSYIAPRKNVLLSESLALKYKNPKERLTPWLHYKS